MDDLFKLVNSFIDKCAKCHGESKARCTWFHELSNPLASNENLTPDQYMEMTYEEIASFYEKEAGYPFCEAQYTFDDLMMEARSILRNSNIPTKSEELIQLLTDIVQIEKRIDRLDSDCETAFMNPVMAVMETCLAHIDYFYLKSGLDIFPLIESVHGDYHRTRLLKGTFIGGVINVYLQKARKLTVEEIVSFPGNLLHLSTPQVPDEPTAPTVPPTSLKEERKVEQKYVADSALPLQSLTEMLTNQEVCDFVAAVSMFLGVRPSNYVEPLINYKKRNFIEKNMQFKQYFTFPYRKELYEEINKEVNYRKHNEQELEVYISGILSPFQYIVPLLHPGDRDIHAAQLEIAFGVAPLFGGYSIKKFAAVFHQAIVDVAERAEIEPEDRLSELHDTLLNKYYNKEEASEDGILVSINDLRSILDIFQCAVEGALLTNGIEHDFKYYQKLTGISFVNGVTDASLAMMTGHSIEFIKNLAKKLQHSIYFATKENETMDAFMMRMVNKKEALELEEYVPDEEIKPAGKPRLIQGPRLADIPLCDVEEIDALEHYFDEAVKYQRYYYAEAEEAFRKKCNAIAGDKTLTKDEKEIWISKVLNTLDSAYAIAGSESPEVQQMAVGYFSVLDFAFLAVAEPICIKKLCFQLDTTLILRQVIPLGEQTKDEDFDVYDFSYPENIYSQCMLETVSGNIVHYERRLCQGCLLVKCPYRNMHSKEGVYIPEEYPQDLLAPLENEKKDGEKKSSGGNSNPGLQSRALPARLKTKKAMAIWEKAKAANIVDSDYRFIGSLGEMAFFAGSFSIYLFSKCDWKLFKQWNPYENYARTFNLYSHKTKEQLSEQMQIIQGLFE